MNKTTEALKIAIEQLEIYAFSIETEYFVKDNDVEKAINACKEALESQEQEYKTRAQLVIEANNQAHGIGGNDDT